MQSGNGHRDGVDENPKEELEKKSQELVRNWEICLRQKI